MQAVDYPQRRYRIILRSTMGPIDVYLVRYQFGLWTSKPPSIPQSIVSSCPNLKYLHFVLVNSKKSLMR